MNQAEIDQANARFWGEEICGTALARRIGSTSIEDFDAAYTKMYPWLPLMASWLLRGPGDRVLEIGPGWGTFGRLLQDRGAIYVPFDIAPQVITHIEATCEILGVVGNVLTLDQNYKAETFDAAAAIGSLHHTGNLPLAIKQLHRVLRPQGRLLAMIYSDQGKVCDDHLDGTPAPYTDQVAVEDIPALFSDFSLINIELRSPHAHADVYVQATK